MRRAVRGHFCHQLQRSRAAFAERKATISAENPPSQIFHKLRGEGRGTEFIPFVRRGAWA